MPHQESHDSKHVEGPIWTPLHVALFRSLWIATVASNIGTWIQDVGAGWLMTTLAPSPLMVSLVQTANTLPMFLLALPAGALADVVDRRKLLLFSQGWMFLAAFSLAILTWFKLINPSLLLVVTFMLGTGVALNMPAWQAILSEIVPKESLRGAITLQGAGMNVARAVGPAMGGFIVASLGIAATFFLNAISFLGVILVLFQWKRTVEPTLLPSERFWSALKLGFRYVYYSPTLKSILMRSAAFMFFGVSLFALLPFLVKKELGLGAGDLGMLLGCLGIGSVLGAVLLPKFKKHVSTDKLTLLATALFTILIFALAFTRSFFLLSAFMFAGGIAWIIMLSNLNVAAQSVSAGWVKARALSAYLLVFYGSMAFGSLTWGSVASHFGLKTAFLMAGSGLALGVPLLNRFKLSVADRIDLTPVNWPAPVIVTEPEHETGPVLVQIEYFIEEAQKPQFIDAMKKLKLSRMRSGAIRWEVFEDLTTPSRFIEEFIVESWVEHLRQHERVTQADHGYQNIIAQFHMGNAAPKVTHMLCSLT